MPLSTGEHFERAPVDALKFLVPPFNTLAINRALQ